MFNCNDQRDSEGDCRSQGKTGRISTGEPGLGVERHSASARPMQAPVTCYSGQVSTNRRRQVQGSAAIRPVLQERNAIPAKKPAISDREGRIEKLWVTRKCAER